MGVAFFLTARDRHLVGAADRDLLGLQPLWSYYGNRLVPTLTSRSTNARHLSASLLFADVYSELAARRARRRLSRTQAAIVLEQVYAYATLQRGEQAAADEETFPGIRKARSRWGDSKNQVRVGPGRSYHLLNGQAGQGIFARYATPLRRMKLIDRRRPEVEYGDGLSAGDIFGSDHESIRKCLLAFLVRFEDGAGEQEFAALIRRDRGFSQKLLAMTGTPAFTGTQRDFWLERLHVSADPLLRRLADTPADGNVKGAVETLLESGADEEDRLLNVVRCESYLAPLDGFLWALVASTSLSEAAEAVAGADPDFKEKLGKAREDFRSLPPPPAGNARRRWSKLKEMPCALETLARELVQYHGEESRSRAVLTAGADGTLVTTRPDWRSLDYEAEGLFEKWRRDYYVGSLWSVAEGLGGTA